MPPQSRAASIVLVAVASCLPFGCGSSQTDSVGQTPPQVAATPDVPSAPQALPTPPNATAPQADTTPEKVDYAAVYDARLAEGVTPDTNAAVLLWQAYGPASVPEQLRDRFCTQLGVSGLDPEGEYLVAFSDFAATAPEGVSRSAWDDERSQMLGAARSHTWKRGDFPLVSNWLDRNAEPISLIEQAVQRPKFYWPLLLHPERQRLVNAEFQHAVYARRAAELLATRAMLRLGEADEAGAWRDVIRLNRLAGLLSSRASQVEWYVARVVQWFADIAVRELCSRANDTSWNTSSARAGFDADSMLLDAADVMDQAERLIFMDSCSRIVLDPNELPGLFVQFGLPVNDEVALTIRESAVGIDRDGSLKTAVSWLDKLCAAMRRESRSDRLAAVSDVETQLAAESTRLKSDRELLQRFVQGSPTDRSALIGEMMACLLLPSASQLQNAEDQLLTQRELSRTALALMAHRTDHAAYPDGLNQLVPEYLPGLPPDPYNDKSLTYHRDADGYVLYSVGPNGVDDGGRSSNDGGQGDDVASRIPKQ